MTDILIGPNTCGECGGEYGDHQVGCQVAKRQRMEGVKVTEEELATGLGFANVTEMRRWQTELGTENQELRHALSGAMDEARNFQWHVKRMYAVLQKVSDHFEGKPVDRAKLHLAVDVMLSKRVDWKRVLKDWLEPLTQET